MSDPNAELKDALQHTEPTEAQLDDIKNVQSIAKDVALMLADLEINASNNPPDEGPDRRWLAIAKTHFQEGFMAARRAILRPSGF